MIPHATTHATHAASEYLHTAYRSFVRGFKKEARPTHRVAYKLASQASQMATITINLNKGVVWVPHQSVNGECK